MRSAEFLLRAAGGLLNLVYPQDCIACGRDVDVDAQCLCEGCRAAMPRIGRWQCPRCGDEIGPYTAGRIACPSCSRRDGLMFRAAVAACRYEGPARAVVHRLKYGADLRAVRMMADAMVEKLRGQQWLGEIDVVTPAPLHWTRRIGRRFNQAEVLARDVAGALSMECDSRLLRRVRRTDAQASLRGSAREENVRSAFAARTPDRVAGRTVLLVDDVMTTCATATACARSLLDVHARRVYVAVFAR